MSEKNPCPFCGAPEVFDNDEIPMRCPSCDEMIGDSSSTSDD